MDTAPVRYCIDGNGFKCLKGVCLATTEDGSMPITGWICKGMDAEAVLDRGLPCDAWKLKSHRAR